MKGELKAILNERDKLSVLNDPLTTQQATLSTDYQLLKQYEAVSASYNVAQEKTDVLTIQLEKMQAALDKSLD